MFYKRAPFQTQKVVKKKKYLNTNTETHYMINKGRGGDVMQIPPV